MYTNSLKSFELIFSIKIFIIRYIKRKREGEILISGIFMRRNLCLNKLIKFVANITVCAFLFFQV